MGCEYSIKYAIEDIQETNDILCSLPLFLQVDHGAESGPLFIYRHSENVGQLPNAVIEVTPEGFYFCDYGDGLKVLKELVFRLALNGGPLDVMNHND